MFRVEFIGIPGAGKTTVRKALVASLNSSTSNSYMTIEEAMLNVSRKNIDIFYRTILRILPWSLALKLSNWIKNRSLMHFEAQNSFLAAHGKSFLCFLDSAAYKSLSMQHRQIVISSFLEIGISYECISKHLHEETTVFFEEGLVQKSFMFITLENSANTDSDPSLISYLDNVPLPDLLIYINASNNNCYNRMATRPDGLTKRLEKCSKEEVLNFIKKSREHLEKTSNYLKEKRNVTLIEFNNNNNLDDVISELTTIIIHHTTRKNCE